jgi:superfamily II DNA helicase RecQ
MAGVAEVAGAAVSYTLSLGYSLKKEQLDVIVKYVMGRDVFVVLPTGYGKSLCYHRLTTYPG